MKNLAKIAALFLVIVALIAVSVFSYGQQYIVDQITTRISERFGVSVRIEGFDLSIVDARVMADVVEVTDGHSAKIRLDGILIALSAPDLVQGAIVLPTIWIGRLTSSNAQKVAAKFSSAEPNSVDTQSGGLKLPFQLLRGRIDALHIVESIGETGRLEVGGGSLSVATTSRGGLEVVEHLKGVLYEKLSHDPVVIGDIEGSQRLEGHSIVLESLKVSSGIADVSGSSISILPRLGGSLKFSTDTERAPAPKNIKAAIDGTLSLSGTIQNPRLAATLRAVDGLFLDDQRRLDSLSLRALYVSTGAGFEVTVEDLEAGGDAGTIRTKSPLKYSPGSISGGLLVDLREMRTESYGFSSFGGHVDLDGSIDRPKVDSDLTLVGLYASMVRFGDIRLTTQYDHSTDRLSISGSESPNAFGATTLQSTLSFGGVINQTSTLTFDRKFPDQGIRASGSIESSGGVTLASARASANITGELVRESYAFPFVMSAALSDGVVTGTLSQNTLVKSNYSIDLRPGRESKVDLTIDQPKLSTWIPSLACGSATLAANLRFLVSDPMSAAGTVSITKFALGCGRLAVTIGGKPIRFQDQKLFVDSLEFTSLAGILRATGTASRDLLNMHLKGSLDLPFVGHLNSVLNDVTGSAEVDVKIAGTPQAPAINGSVEMNKIGGTVSRPAIELSDVRAVADFQGTILTIRELRGTANDGTFKVAGQADISTPLSTLTATLELRNVSLSPIQDAEVWFSADMEVKPKEIDGEMVPSITGPITINDGKLEKQFDQAFIQERIRTWFEATTVSMPSKNEPATYPDLDLKVLGDGSFSVVTNIARADLSPNLTIKGNPKDLQIRGNVGIASGSFDVGRTHFEILSGRVSLWGRRVRLELSAEGEAKDENGFPIVISMELSGDASDPRVTLTSDNGLTQEEIVKLLAAGGGLGGQSLFDQAVSAAGFSEIGLLTEDSWISTITGVDDLSIEPSHDLATGQTSSKVYTAKQITDEIRLSGQFPFTGQGQSKISTEYAVSTLLGVEASYRPPSAAFKPSAGIDLNWAILAQTRRWPVEFEGNESFGDTVLINVLSLSKRSRMSEARLSALERKLRRYYNDRGYLDVTVTATCQEGCSYANIAIREGPRYVIREVTRKGNLDTADTALEKPETIVGQPATRHTLLSVQRTLTTSQRKKGYYRARIVAKFEKIPDTHEVRLAVKGWKRQRYLFELAGNHTFAFEEFSKALRLEDQSFPFGPNLPGEFITAVEQYYLERGYADLRITSTLTSQAEVITLRLDITEGKKYTIKRVRFIGSPIDKRKLEKDLPAGTVKTVFNPPVLYRAAVQYGRIEIQKLLVARGYPEAKVDAEEVRLNEDSAEVRYSIEPGKPQQFVTIIEGLPEDVQGPEIPADASLEKIQQEMERLKGRLSRAGYKGADVNLDAAALTAKARIVVVPGLQEKISSIEVRGNQRVETRVILESLALSPGDPLSLRSLAEARNRVLKRGLFSEVSVTSDETTRTVTVSVRERTLQSLSVTTGYDSEFGIHLGVNGIDRSFFSDGKELSARGDVYYDYDEAALGRGFGALRFKNPNAFEDTAWIEELGFTNTRDSSFQEFDLTSVYFRSTFEHTFSPKMRIKAGHMGESFRSSDVPDDIILSEFDRGTFVSSALLSGIEYTDQDDPLTPRYSRRAAVEGHFARSELGSDVDYLTVQPSVLILQPTRFFDSRLSLLASARGGIGRTFGDEDELPLPKRYRLGGQDSVRGYRENSLGPRGEKGSVIGGDMFYQATTEVRYELFDKLHVLSFLDVGNLWLESMGRGRNNFGTGVGVRYGSPIGSLGADIGVPVNPEDGSRQPRFYLRLGATF